ncbi:MAG: DUF4332 domain-containing protein [Chloroflexota bacterium]
MAFKELKGLTPAVAEKLKAQGVDNAEELLGKGKTPKGRQEFAKTAGIDGKLLLELLNRADLARVNGVGGVYADLLEEAGVDTIKELATRVPANLHAKIVAVNDAKKLTTRPPTADQVADWVGQAKALPKLIEY